MQAECTERGNVFQTIGGVALTGPCPAAARDGRWSCGKHFGSSDAGLGAGHSFLRFSEAGKDPSSSLASPLHWLACVAEVSDCSFCGCALDALALDARPSIAPRASLRTPRLGRCPGRPQIGASS